MKLRNKKTGEVQTCDFMIISDDSSGDGETARLNSHVFIFRSIEQLNEEYEDYKPAEPLIKDEMTHEAVKAWACANSIKKVMYAERPDRSLCLLTDMGEDEYNIEFVGWIPTLKDGEEYTIAELCGEDE